MKKDDKDLLKMLAVLGALIIAGGTGMAMFMAHRGSKSPVTNFVFGSAMSALIITAAARSNE